MAGTVSGEVEASLFVAGALFGGILGMAGAGNVVFLDSRRKGVRVARKVQALRTDGLRM